MSKDKHMAWIKSLLLAFVFVSIGFSLGRHSVKPLSAGTLPPSSSKTSVQVYYLHSAFRCTTCNTIEKMTKALLDRQYKAELSSGDMAFHEVNFQTDEALAKQFGVVASCVVVTAVKDGKTVDFQRLDEVWTLMKDPVAFDKYINDAIAAMQKKGGGAQ